jgi:hypothetical protein
VSKPKITAKKKKDAKAKLVSIVIGIISIPKESTKTQIGLTPNYLENESLSLSLSLSLSQTRTHRHTHTIQRERNPNIGVEKQFILAEFNFLLEQFKSFNLIQCMTIK